MKVLTIHHLKQRKDDFCFGIEGELALPSLVCDSKRCGCDRAFGGLNSHQASTTLMVRDLDLTYDDVIMAYIAYLEAAGWAARLRGYGGDDDVLRYAQDMVAEMLAFASDYPDQQVVRVKFDRKTDDWKVLAA